MNRFLLLLLPLALGLSACQSPGVSAPPTPVQLDGMYGGVLSHQGTDFVALAMELVTTSAGAITGDAVGTTDGSSFGYMSVSGTSQATGDVSMTLTDLAGDWLRLDGSFDGTRFSGGWTTNVGPYTGTFRIAHEDDVDTLNGVRLQGGLSLRELIGLE